MLYFGYKYRTKRDTQTNQITLPDYFYLMVNKFTSSIYS